MVTVWVLHMLHFVLFYQDEENVVSPKTMQKLLLLVCPRNVEMEGKYFSKDGSVHCKK